MRGFPAERFDEATGLYVSDSVRVGDLPMTANEKSFPSLKEAQAYINSLADTSLITFNLFRTSSEEQEMTYRLQKRLFPSDAVMELQPTAWVIEVTPGGASDRAGMKVGNFITRINRQTFTSVTEADRILRQGQIGKTIEYEVLRDNQTLTLHVTLASFGFQIGILGDHACTGGTSAALSLQGVNKKSREDSTKGTRAWTLAGRSLRPRA